MTPTPTTFICGALGVGKTSAILDLARHQPAGERWAVLVNEFGEVGIDGAVMEGGGLEVAELAGGCLCCTSRGPLLGSIQALLREHRPDRLLVEPSGLADPGAVLDMLASAPELRVGLQAVVTLVDPRTIGTKRGADRVLWQAQVDAAEIVVLNRVDRCTPGEIRDALAWADDLWPPKRAVATTTGGALDPAWLSWPAAGQQPEARDGTHAHPNHGDEHSTTTHAHAEGALLAPSWQDLTGLLPAELGRRLFRRAWAGPDHTTCGWRLPPGLCFTPGPLYQLLERLVAGGAMRVKGVFRTTAGWQVVQADADGLRTRPTAWRRDSRLEVITPRPGPDWVGVDAALLGCAPPRPPPGGPTHPESASPREP
jgi:G3E family GTPase